MSATTFACPHCGASYPRKPVLVGRTVRCTTCKNAFRLREDGIADKVEASAPAPTTPTAAPPITTEPLAPFPARSAPIRVNTPAPVAAAGLDAISLDQNDGQGDQLILTPAQPHPVLSSPDAIQSAPAVQIPVPRPAPTATTAHGNPGKTSRLTVQQLEARRAMAATLTSSLSAALQAEPTQSPKKNATQRMAKAGMGEGKVGKISAAVLTGTGNEEAQNSRRWMLGCLIAVLLVVGGCWLITHRSPAQQALDEFVLADAAKVRQAGGDRITALQTNAWFSSMPPNGQGVTAMSDLGAVKLGKAKTLNLTPVQTVVGDLIKGYVPLADQSGWGEASAPAAPTDASGKNAPAAKIKTVKRTLVAEALSKAGLDKEDTELAIILLMGRTRDGQHVIADKMLSGSWPDRIDLVSFSGPSGAAILRGQSKSFATAFRGHVLHFSGAGWPDEWKILTLQVGPEP